MWGVEGTAPLERLADGGMGELARRVVLANDMVGVGGAFTRNIEYISSSMRIIGMQWGFQFSRRFNPPNRIIK